MKSTEVTEGTVVHMDISAGRKTRDMDTARQLVQALLDHNNGDADRVAAAIDRHENDALNRLGYTQSRDTNFAMQRKALVDITGNADHHR